MPPKSDLVYPSLDDFVDVNESVRESVVEKPTFETNEPETARKENGAPIIEDWVSDSDEENVPKVKTVEMFNKPSFAKINFVKSTEQVKSPRKTSVDKNRQNIPCPRGNKRNWNQQMSQKLGNNFEMFNKACHVCGSFDHLKNDCNNWSLNTARPVNTVQPRTTVNNAGPMKNVINNAYSTAKRPFNKITATNNSNFTKKVNTVKGTKVNTARPKAVLSAVKGNKRNAIKASTLVLLLASWKEPNPYLADYEELMEDLLPWKEVRPYWPFDNDALTNSMSYKPVVAGNQSNGNTSTKACADAVYGCADDPNIPDLEEIGRFISLVPTTRIHKDHPLNPVIRDLQSATQTRQMTKNLEEYGNKKDERGIVIKNKARLVAQGYTQEEGIDYDEFFASVARIKAIRLFLAYASFKDFVVYQMDVNSAFLYGKIEEEVYVCQPPGFEDPDFPDKVYKVEKALYGLHQAPRACDVKTASTPMETHKPLLKDTDGEDVDEHLYRSMIGSLMYLTSSRPDIKLLLISWQCKKQTVVANFTTEAEYIAASNCSGQVLWIQNQFNAARHKLTAARKLMLLGINLLLLGKVNAARHKLTTAW
ncbi:putative ribonuclease H-like domain-containing protein, partial [Tanacetum coccineum]